MRKSQKTSLHSQASTITKASLMAHHVPTHSLPCQRFLPSPSSADRWSTRNVIQISLFNQISTRFACLTGQCDMVMWLTKVQSSLFDFISPSNCPDLISVQTNPASNTQTAWNQTNLSQHKVEACPHQAITFNPERHTQPKRNEAHTQTKPLNTQRTYINDSYI